MPKLQGPLEEYYIGEPNSGCWLWLGWTNRDGYGQLWDGELKRSPLAHRAVYEKLVGPIPEGMKLLHRCDVPCCVNPEHMFIGTVADNNADMRAKKRHARGAGHGRSKLSEEQVIEVRAAAGTHREIAAKFGISHATVNDIKMRKRWKHLEDQQ